MAEGGFSAPPYAYHHLSQFIVEGNLIDFISLHKTFIDQRRKFLSLVKNNLVYCI